MATQNAKKIIQDRGGPFALSRALTAALGHRVPETTVCSWHQENAIPAWRVAAVLAIPKVEKPTKRASA